MKPKFSLVMASYNHQPFISQAIQSVLKQTFKEWELVIVDDASSDNSVAVIQPFLTDKRIRFYKHIHNKGYAQNTIEAIHRAQSEVIGILDSDDTLELDAVNIMYQAHQKNPQVGLIYSQFKYGNQDLTVFKKGDCQSIPSGKSNLEVERISHFKTFKKLAYLQTTGVNPKMINAEDFDLILKLEEVAPVLFINKPLYNYRVTPNSLSHQPYLNQIGLFSCIIAKNEAYQRRFSTSTPSISKAKLFRELLKGFKIALQLQDRKRSKLILTLILKLSKK